MTTAEIQSMSTTERLRTMEDLWQALCNGTDEVKSPNWHEQLLNERRERIESGEADFISIDELKEKYGK